MPMSLKKSATRFGSAAPPLTASFRRPPRALMGLAENDRAEIDSGIANQALIELAKLVERGVKEGAARLDLVEDAAMDRLPQRGNADQRGGPQVGKRARKIFRIDANRMSDRRATRERQQHPAGEFEGVMEREQREHKVVAGKREHAPEHLDLGGEIPMREHHALGRAGGARGENDRSEVLAIRLRRRGDRFLQNERT